MMSIMGIGTHIRRILSIITWGLTGTGVLVLLVAAIRYRNNNTCKGILIGISGPSTGFFIGKKDIASLLTPAGSPKIQDRPIQSFDLHHMETSLQKNIWIKKARLFFDNNGILHVDVTERTPATRIFTNEGSSFYLDSEGVQLPVIPQLAARLPVFTAYPARSSGHQSADGHQSATGHRQPTDSLLTTSILHISEFIRDDSFWSAQIAQINILPDRTFELEPEIGDHRISFGDGSDIAQKFHRLFLFYSEVLSRTGFDKYERIDVSYAGQVVATRKGSGQSRYDSLQGMNNIRQLIRSAQQLQPDTIRQQAVRPLENNKPTEQDLENHDLLPVPDSAIKNKKTTKIK
jgi:cell division protein FtsQ